MILAFALPRSFLSDLIIMSQLYKPNPWYDFCNFPTDILRFELFITDVNFNRPQVGKGGPLV